MFHVNDSGCLCVAIGETYFFPPPPHTRFSPLQISSFPLFIFSHPVAEVGGLLENGEVVNSFRLCYEPPFFFSGYTSLFVSSFSSDKGMKGRFGYTSLRTEPAAPPFFPTIFFSVYAFFSPTPLKCFLDLCLGDSVGLFIPLSTTFYNNPLPSRNTPF